MAFALGPRARSSGYRLEAFETIESTNAEALERIRAGENGPLWLVSDHQTAGRGRRQRAWISPPGNLAATVIETVDVKPQVAVTLGFAAGLALEAALKKVSMESLMRSSGSTKFSLKWPNDVLADGKKNAGILLEAETVERRLSLAIGIGANIVSAPEGTPYPATALHTLGVDISAGDLFMALSDEWSEMRGIWDNGKGFAEIRRLWLDAAAGIGEPVSIQSEAHTVEGIFETLDGDGCLVLAKPDGKRIKIAAGDVYFGAVRSSGAA
jgi:BirA family transcriptional regulator, biotin operon repressor / biotin---[acetyl-CoA-carboxylase] ligase